MMEAEWLAATDPEAMLEFLGDRASNRKLRLFAVACRRLVWHHLTVDPGLEVWVQMVERFADGDAEKEDFDALIDDALSQPNSEPDDAGAARPDEHYFRLALQCLASTVAASVMDTAYRIGEYALEADSTAVLRAAQWAAKHTVETATYEARVAAKLLNPVRVTGSPCQVARCVFGNPFRPVAFDPAWRTSTVVALAEGIYADRAFDRLPILADALMDAGCDAADILAHCRGDGPHVRGCWVVDAVLGKE